MKTKTKHTYKMIIIKVRFIWTSKSVFINLCLENCDSLIQNNIELYLLIRYMYQTKKGNSNYNIFLFSYLCVWLSNMESETDLVVCCTICLLLASIVLQKCGFFTILDKAQCNFTMF